MTGRDGYLKAREYLRRDFVQRCAYCMLHEQEGNGPDSFWIDHFQPRSKGGPINDYLNLYWSCIPCNSIKSDQWPERSQVENGCRFVDPCREWDYGVHFLEDKVGQLVGQTTCGEYHIAALRLNRMRLCQLRLLQNAKQVRLSSAMKILSQIENLLLDEKQSQVAVKRRLIEFVHAEMQALQAELLAAIPLYPLEKDG